MADLFIASDSELNGISEAPSPINCLPGLADADVDLLMLCNLESILTGSDWESVFDRDYVNPICDHGPDGPWIYQVSKGLLDALRCLSPEAMIECARVWAETDEWTLRTDTCPEKVAEVISGLAGLAKSARAQEKHVFLWTRL